MFDDHYQKWLEEQGSQRTGEAFRRISENHGYAEKLFAENVWWPAIGSFNNLHAEYEIRNHRDGFFYLDFAYTPHPMKINWEIDDFSTHAKMMDRRGFIYERERQNQLMLDGWQIYRLPLDLIKERPRQCQQFVLQVIGKLMGRVNSATPFLSMKHKEIMRLALRLQRPFSPAEVCTCLGIHGQHARGLLLELVKFELLLPASGSARIRSYALGPKSVDIQWGML